MILFEVARIRGLWIRRWERRHPDQCSSTRASAKSHRVQKVSSTTPVVTWRILAKASRVRSDTVLGILIKYTINTGIRCFPSNQLRSLAKYDDSPHLPGLLTRCAVRNGSSKRTHSPISVVSIFAFVFVSFFFRAQHLVELILISPFRRSSFLVT